MTPAEPNLYSHQWFEFFHVGIDRARTRQETEFICRCAPLPEFRKILDVCCGMGRHARALSNRGYSVTGIDRNADVIAKARELAGGRSYVVANIRDYQPAPETFDAAIMLGQSFGHFDDGTNRAVLRRLADGVRKSGRVILDLWNPDFFASHQGARELKTARGVVKENKRMDGDRLRVQLAYPDGDPEEFEWQLFTPPKMISLAQSVGLALLLSCTDFSSTITPSPAKPRIQFVFERSGKG
ncbi:MAG TPA: class I SAM-dependent methyltransferase [Chthoniobacterales bacterium]|jgi:SAM-dependent methyltransferase|nr:class I SAM-dependent methyltransferase [Chthoniobacterales bacterium]